MKIFNKKVTLSFYAYSSVAVLLIFIVTSICEHCLPTTLFVKSLIVFSTICFIITGTVYVVNEIRKKPILLFFILALFMGLFLILFFNESDDKKYNLSGHYTKNATQYQGSIYKQGFALSGKIDDKSLVSSPLWQTLLKGGIKQKDFYLFRSFFYYWWHNFSLKDINNDKHFLCVEKDKLLYYRQGDVVLKENNHYAVFIKYESLKQPKKELWITCTPERGCYEFITNDTAGKYDVYRWKIFEKYLNR